MSNTGETCPVEVSENMNSEDIELLGVLVRIDGKVYPVLISDENKDVYLRTIADHEGAVRIVDKPLNSLRLETGE